MVKLAIEEEGTHPKSMSGIRDKLILCMDRPREQLSSDAWRPIAIRDECKQCKVKERRRIDVSSGAGTKPVW